MERRIISWPVVKVRVSKICSCGRPHEGERELQVSDMGGFWNCACGSTMFLPVEELPQEVA